MRKRELIVGMALGAGAVYYLDPRDGADRRARLARRVRGLLGETADEGRGLERAGRDDWPAAAPGRYGARLGDIGGLEAANLGTQERAGPLLGVAGALGALLALYGLTRRGMAGMSARAVGTGLLMSRIRERRTTAEARERRRIVDIQKTLRIEAPVVRVYDFWRDATNFPLFLANVRRVEDLGAGRSRWTLVAPGGMPVQWEALITMEKPGELLAWRSRPGSALESAGAVRFSREGSGTRLDLRFCYNPSGADVATADLFGADPRAQLNQDLGRLKALLESEARSEAHGQEPGA